VAVLHGLLILLTLVALASLPCMLALIVTADYAAENLSRALRRRLRRLRARRDARALVRRAGLTVGTSDARPAGPPIEQIAADLRRLGRQRIGVATRSPVWFAAVQRAYDDRLSLACLELDIPQHLCNLTGMDLEIERVRVEGELHAAGIGLVSGDGRGAHGPNWYGPGGDGLGGDELGGDDADHRQDLR
jgi:hypothetical protein